MSKRRRGGTYQLADVLEDTDIILEVVRDLQFQEHLKELAEEQERLSSGEEAVKV